MLIFFDVYGINAAISLYALPQCWGINKMLSINLSILLLKIKLKIKLVSDRIVFLLNLERSEICQGDGMGRYRFRTGGMSPRTLTGRCTSLITTREKPRGLIPETGEH